jgi:hypothetical protein
MPRVPRRFRWLIAGGPLALLLGLAPGAAPAQALTRPPPTGVLHTTYGAPAMVATNSAVVITAADNHGNIDSWYQAAGTTSWTFQRVATAAGGVFYNSPVIAAMAGSVAIAAVDTGGGLDYWQQSAGSTGWVASPIAAGRYTSPAITVASYNFEIAAVDQYGDLDTWERYPAEAGWAPPEPAADSSSAGRYSAVSINWSSGTMLVTAIAAGQLLTWHLISGNPQWTADPVPGTGVVSASVTATGSGFEIAAGSPPGEVGTWFESANPAGWPGPDGVAGTFTEPSITWGGQGLSLAARDGGGSLWSFYQPAGPQWFSDQIVSSSGTGHTYSSPSAAETSTMRFVSAIDNDGDLDFWSQSGSGRWVADPVAVAT